MNRIFYKVTDSENPLYQACKDFMDMENNLEQIQWESIKKEVPEFEFIYSQKGFSRIIEPLGFVFKEPDKLDSKVWVTKSQNGKMLSIPNRRTKAGKAMLTFLHGFKRTTIFDLDRVLHIERDYIGQFYTPYIFIFKDVLYISIDEIDKSKFEQNNHGFVEITHGEMNSVLDERKAQNEQN